MQLNKIIFTMIKNIHVLIITSSSYVFGQDEKKQVETFR